jgi:hypothetical protein
MCVGRTGKGEVEACCQISERRKVKDSLEVRPPRPPSTWPMRNEARWRVAIGQDGAR